MVDLVQRERRRVKQETNRFTSEAGYSGHPLLRGWIDREQNCETLRPILVTGNNNQS